MKLVNSFFIILILILITGCSRSPKVIGDWYYKHVSSTNGGTTEFTFHLNDDKTCSYDMEYTLLNKKIIDQTNYCTWKISGEYIIYETNGKESKLSYDSENDVLYTIDSDTELKDWKMVRK